MYLYLYSVRDRFYADATSNTSSDIVVGWYVELTYCALFVAGLFSHVPVDDDRPLYVAQVLEMGVNIFSEAQARQALWYFFFVSEE